MEQQEQKAINAELQQLLNTDSFAEQTRINQFKREEADRNVWVFCEHKTRDRCYIHQRQQARAKSKLKSNSNSKSKPESRAQLTLCKKIHFTVLMRRLTDFSKGDCHMINGVCYQRHCQRVHYVVDERDKQAYNSYLSQNRSKAKGADKHKHKHPLDDDLSTTPRKKHKRSHLSMSSSSSSSSSTATSMTPSPRRSRKAKRKAQTLPAQWINHDIRELDFSILGKFDVIMADPPWAIRMDLPYKTMQNEEILNLRVDCLQDDGVIFLWVTARAMELGRKCLKKWGYTPRGELVWVKINQQQRMIVTGRTGYYLNHTKEHCLIGIKGNPDINRNVDCDVMLSEIRETSRKPCEMYQLLERLSPGGRKLEIFGRKHNLQEGWVTLGNQLDGSHLCDPRLIENMRKYYPGVGYTREGTPG